MLKYMWSCLRIPTFQTFALGAHLRCVILRLCSFRPEHGGLGDQQTDWGEAFSTQWINADWFYSALLFTYLPQHSGTLLNKGQPISAMDLKCQGRGESGSWKKVDVWCLQWKKVTVTLSCCATAECKKYIYLQFHAEMNVYHFSLIWNTDFS